LIEIDKLKNDYILNQFTSMKSVYINEKKIGINPIREER